MKIISSFAKIEMDEVAIPDFDNNSLQQQTDYKTNPISRSISKRY